jgi:aspartate aminotransferase
MTRYTPVAGTPELRALIARKLKEENGLAVTPSQVVVTAGAKQAIYHALLALVDPGDSVLVPQPAWPSYVEMVRLVGGTPVPVQLTAENGWKLTSELLMQALAKTPRRPGVLIFNQPANPTGVYSRRNSPGSPRSRAARNCSSSPTRSTSTWRSTARSRRCHAARHARLHGHGQRLLEGVLDDGLAHGLLCGARAGDEGRVRDPEQHRGLPRASRSTPRCARSRPSCGGRREPLTRMQAAFKLRRDVVCRLLDAIPGVHYVKPGGAFYVFVDVSSWYGKPLAKGRVCLDSMELAAYLLDEAGVAVVPGGAFGGDRCIRLSFATAAEDLTVALKRIHRALAG